MPASNLPTPPGKTADIVNTLAKSIISGKLRVGERLPAERVLAAQLGVSKTAVHSGIEKLEQMGLVTARPQSGVYVANFLENGNLETLNAIATYGEDQLGEDLTTAILDLRLAIEGSAFRRLAGIHTAEDIQALSARVAEMRSQAENPAVSLPALAEAFFRWHREVCVRSKSALLPLLMNALHDISMPFWTRYLTVLGLPAALDRLEQFCDLLQAADGEGAVQLLETGIAEFVRLTR